jgi:SAM-dependent methyltransferase
MDLAKRVIGMMQSGLKSYGPSNLKRKMWDAEYSSDKWDFADNTLGDCVYGHLEKHARNGSILDLGCGTNTGNELAEQCYRRYVGTDISEVCLNKARTRTKEIGRAAKNDFVVADFMTYEPNEKFDVILFRESMYHVPMNKIKETLDRYAKYLTDDGVFVIRMATSGPDGKTKARPAAMFDIIEREFKVVEKGLHEKAGSKATVLVVRPA